MAHSLQRHIRHFIADVGTEVQDALHFDVRRQQITVTDHQTSIKVVHKTSTVTFAILTDGSLQTVLIIENGDEKPTRRTIPVDTDPDDIARHILAALA